MPLYFEAQRSDTSKCRERNNSEMGDWLRNAICDLIILWEETMVHSCQTTCTSFHLPSPYSRWIVLLNWRCARGRPVQFYWKFNKVYNVTLWRIRVTVLNVETQQFVSCVYCWRTCVSVSIVITTESVAMEAQQRFLCIVALHRSLPTEWNTLNWGTHVKCRVLLSNCNQIWNFLTDFRKSPQYEIRRIFVQ